MMTHRTMNERSTAELHTCVRLYISCLSREENGGDVTSTVSRVAGQTGACHTPGHVTHRACHTLGHVTH